MIIKGFKCYFEDMVFCREVVVRYLYKVVKCDVSEAVFE